MQKVNLISYFVHASSEEHICYCGLQRVMDLIYRYEVRIEYRLKIPIKKFNAPRQLLSNQGV